MERKRRQRNYAKKSTGNKVSSLEVSELQVKKKDHKELEKVTKKKVTFHEASDITDKKRDRISKKINANEGKESPLEKMETRDNKRKNNDYDRMPKSNVSPLEMSEISKKRDKEGQKINKNERKESSLALPELSTKKRDKERQKINKNEGKESSFDVSEKSAKKSDKERQKINKNEGKESPLEIPQNQANKSDIERRKMNRSKVNKESPFEVWEVQENKKRSKETEKISKNEVSSLVTKILKKKKVKGRQKINGNQAKQESPLKGPETQESTKDKERQTLKENEVIKESLLAVSDSQDDKEHQRIINENEEKKESLFDVPEIQDNKKRDNKPEKILKDTVSPHKVQEISSKLKLKEEEKYLKSIKIDLSDTINTNDIDESADLEPMKLSVQEEPSVMDNCSVILEDIIAKAPTNVIINLVNIPDTASSPNLDPIPEEDTSELLEKVVGNSDHNNSTYIVDQLLDKPNGNSDPSNTNAGTTDAPKPSSYKENNIQSSESTNFESLPVNKKINLEEAASTNGQEMKSKASKRKLQSDATLPKAKKPTSSHSHSQGKRKSEDNLDEKSKKAKVSDSDSSENKSQVIKVIVTGNHKVPYFIPGESSFRYFNFFENKNIKIVIANNVKENNIAPEEEKKMLKSIEEASANGEQIPCNENELVPWEGPTAKEFTIKQLKEHIAQQTTFTISKNALVSYLVEKTNKIHIYYKKIAESLTGLKAQLEEKDEEIEQLKYEHELNIKQMNAKHNTAKRTQKKKHLEEIEELTLIQTDATKVLTSMYNREVKALHKKLAEATAIIVEPHLRRKAGKNGATQKITNGYSSDSQMENDDIQPIQSLKKSTNQSAAASKPTPNKKSKETQSLSKIKATGKLLNGQSKTSSLYKTTNTIKPPEFVPQRTRPNILSKRKGFKPMKKPGPPLSVSPLVQPSSSLINHQSSFAETNGKQNVNGNTNGILPHESMEVDDILPCTLSNIESLDPNSTAIALPPKSKHETNISSCSSSNAPYPRTEERIIDSQISQPEKSVESTNLETSIPKENEEASIKERPIGSNIISTLRIDDSFVYANKKFIIKNPPMKTGNTKAPIKPNSSPEKGNIVISTPSTSKMSNKLINVVPVSLSSMFEKTISPNKKAVNPSSLSIDIPYNSNAIESCSSSESSKSNVSHSKEQEEALVFPSTSKQSNGNTKKAPENNQAPPANAQDGNDSDIEIIEDEDLVPVGRPGHPAPFDEPNSELITEKPQLTVRKQENGRIQLLFNMYDADQAELVKCYALYCYPESDRAPHPSLWKQSQLILPLKLPMATVINIPASYTQNKTLHFAIRARDKYNKHGPFSNPGSLKF